MPMKLSRTFLSACMVALAGLATSTAALADDDAKIEARIGAWGRACKNEVAVRFPKSVMADITVELGATLRESINAGQITLKDVNQSGLIFNWQYKKHIGYCETDGSGNITKFVKDR